MTFGAGDIYIFNTVMLSDFDLNINFPLSYVCVFFSFYVTWLSASAPCSTEVKHLKKPFCPELKRVGLYRMKHDNGLVD